jgi:hypothetical protein
MSKGLIAAAAMAALAIAAQVPARAQKATNDFPKEEFTAAAVVNNAQASGAGRVVIRVNRWSTDEESDKFVKTLREKGPDALLDLLSDAKSVGRLSTPDSIGYDLRYAVQRRDPDGGRTIVLATDRPIGFWEKWNDTRSVDYPFAVVQMHFDAKGHGTGTLSYAAKITATERNIILEDFSTAPIMLTNIESKTDD